jgi:acyl carrier protein
MNRDQIYARLTELLIRQFEVPGDAISLGAHLFEDLDLDSIDAIDFMVTLEEETGLRVEEDELRALRRVEDIVELVYAKLAAA